MKLIEAVSYIELIKDLANHLHGTLTAIEIPRRMYASIRHALEEAHCYNRPVPVSDAINSIQMKHKSISVDLVCIWSEDKAPVVCEWDEIMYESMLIKAPVGKRHTDAIACFSDIINTGYMLTMERPEKIRMNAAAIHEMHIAVGTSSHMVACDPGFRALVLNEVRLMPLPNTSIKGASATLYRELNENPWTQEPWEEFGSVIWKGQKEKSKDLFDLEKEMELLINNLKG